MLQNIYFEPIFKVRSNILYFSVVCRQVHPSEQTQRVPYTESPKASNNTCTKMHGTNRNSNKTINIDSNSNTRSSTIDIPSRCKKGVCENVCALPTFIPLDDNASVSLIRQPISPVSLLPQIKGYPTTPNLVMKRGKVEIMGQGKLKNVNQDIH